MYDLMETYRFLRDRAGSPPASADGKGGYEVFRTAASATLGDWEEGGSWLPDSTLLSQDGSCIGKSHESAIKSTLQLLRERDIASRRAAGSAKKAR